jgi:hypothetical protein
VLQKLDGETRVLEFDFKSFFNTITLSAVFKRLGKYGPYPAYLISNMVATDTVRFKSGIKEEKEYVIQTDGTYRKSGLPQGLSISPLLATLALEDETTPKSIVMYADDGLYFQSRGEENTFFK